jgi:hypothetical protein
MEVVMNRTQTPRLVSEEPFPPYSYVPGRFPHPESDPAGHSFGKKRPPAAALDPARWTASRPYLYGLDLFNAGFFWESHVAFESLWLAAGRKGEVADFLKALVHLAAAGVKHLEGNPAGVKSHAHRAAELWKEVAKSSGRPDELFLGFRFPDLIDTAETVFRDGWPDSALVLLPALPG